MPNQNQEGKPVYFSVKEITKLSPGKRYYDLLQKNEQNAYNLLVAGICRQEACIPIPLSRQEIHSIRRVIAAIGYDCPELFYADLTHYTPKKGNCIAFDYLYTAEDRIPIEKALRRTWSSLKPKLTPDMSEKKKYQTIALEIASSVRYELTGKEQIYSVVGPVMDHIGVCEGVSKLFLYLCNQAGLPARIISGTSDGTPHCWLQIWIKGKIRYLDVTAVQECPAFYRLVPGAIIHLRWILRLLGIVPKDLTPP